MRRAPEFKQAFYRRFLTGFRPAIKNRQMALYLMAVFRHNVRNGRQQVIVKKSLLKQNSSGSGQRRLDDRV